jgi:hypothetical protein
MPDDAALDAPPAPAADPVATAASDDASADDHGSRDGRWAGNAHPPAADVPGPTVAAAVSCPYLLATTGDWRATAPAREHRCTAFAPAAPLAIEKQRRLCLTADHVGCATYLAALDARRERGLPVDGTTALRWQVVRTTPVIEVGVGLGAAVAGLASDRRAWQVIPAIVLVVAVVAVGLSGFGRDQSPAPLPTRTPAPTASTEPSPTGTPGPTSTVAPTAPPTAPPTATPGPTARTSYKVKSGDTLYDIARSFGTTVTAIKQLNHLTSNTLHVGQVLLIP